MNISKSQLCPLNNEQSKLPVRWAGHVRNAGREKGENSIPDHTRRKPRGNLEEHGQTMLRKNGGQNMENRVKWAEMDAGVL